MKRQDFIKSAAGACLACAGGSFLGGQEPPSAADQTSLERRARKREETFKQNYISTLMENLEKGVDEPTRVRMMNDCGRACARRGELFKTAEAGRGDLKAFLTRMTEILGPDSAVLVDEKTVRWNYPRCYCELVAAGPERLPAVYCQCSVGWVLEMFETVLGRPVKVRLVQSIRTGGPSCVFHIDVAPQA
jgi:hypothetical protein